MEQGEESSSEKSGVDESESEEESEEEESEEEESEEEESEEEEEALRNAAWEGDTEKVQRLLEKGVDPDTEVTADDDPEFTPLYGAAKGGHVGAVRALLEAGARVDSRGHLEDVDSDEQTELLYDAAERPGVDYDEVAMNLGAQVQHGSTPLHAAAEGGHVPVLKLLLKRDIEVDCRDQIGATPLHKAASGGHVGVAEVLLKSGAEVNSRDVDQNTPKDIAASRRVPRFHRSEERKRIREGRKKILELFMNFDAQNDDDHKNKGSRKRRLSTDNMEAEKKLKTSVPVEVEIGDREMRALYEQACKEGTCQVFYIRLILVGQHGNGKTSLTNSLLLLKFDKEEESTDGIVITPCLMTGKEEWKVTKDIKDNHLAHAAATEMKKMMAEKKEQKSTAPRRTGGDKGSKPDHDHRDPVAKGAFETLKHLLTEVTVETGSQADTYNRLAKHMAESRLTFRKEVPTDGNCMFHAVADQLFRTEGRRIDHIQLRKRAVNFLRRHPCNTNGDHFGAFISGQTWEGYLSTMSRDGTWGDHIVLQAMADMFGHDVSIVSSVEAENYVTILTPSTGTVDRIEPPLLLGHYAENHYASLDGLGYRFSMDHQKSPTKRQNLQPSSLHRHGQHTTEKLIGSGTSLQHSPASQKSHVEATDSQPEEQTEEYKLATRIVLGKDDLTKLVGSKEQPAMSTWDFAGHDVYYSSHHVFYSHYAIFILTLNLTKDLSEPLKPWPGSCAEAFQLKTEGDLVDYHLESIRAHTRPNKTTLPDGDQEVDAKRDRQPPVIVVGTRKDQLEQDKVKAFLDTVREHVKGKAISKHVEDRYFAIDNTMRDPEDPELSNLRDFILKVAQQQNHMGRRIPISWLELKSKLMEMEKQGRKYCSLQDVMDATDSSRVPKGFTPERNAVIILRFFHLCGDVLFFDTPALRNFVVLDPQWFMDVQKTIITIPQFRDREVKDKWEQLEATGVLEDSLIKYVWSSRKRQEELKCDLLAYKDEMLKMMEQFGLVLQCSSEREDEAGTSTSRSRHTSYFVPSLLNAVKNKEQLYPKGVKCSKPIFAVFDDKFCPVGVYHRLVIASMRRHHNLKPLAYARCARFSTSNPKQAFVITKERHYLKVELLSSEKEESVCFSHGPGIRKGLDEDLREIINKWIPGLRYKWCLQCCCDSHKDKELDADSFIPIASVTEWFVDGEVVCETYSPATTTIEDIGLGHWFQKPQNQSSASQGSRGQQQESSGASSLSTGDDISSVAQYFPTVVELKPPWRELGRNLGLSDADMEQISHKYQGDAGWCCLAVLEEWQHLPNTNATLEGLKSALDTTGKRAIVEKEQSMRRELLALQNQVTGIVRADFPNLDLVPDRNEKADMERLQLNRKTLCEELFSSSFNYSLHSVVYDLIQERKKSVCRINYPGGSGTGFLLSKEKVLTCYHVYEGMARSKQMFTDLDLFTATFFLSVGKKCEVHFHAMLLKGHSEELDYAILQLAVDDEIKGILSSLPCLGRYLPTIEDVRNMVVIVGHPSGGDKVVDFCRIAGLDKDYIIHVKCGNPDFPHEDPRKPLYHTGVMFYCSSGSPGFDTNGNVMLMHTRGFFPDSSRPSIIERGVRLSAIREHARQNLAPEDFSEIFPDSPMDVLD